MVKDTLNSVFDNLKERTTNPFLGTLMVVWILKNWKLVYSLFYFDSSLKLDDRLGKITDHFKDQSFLLNMGLVILMTLGVLILTYILLSLSRLVTDAYERIVIPVISKWTDKSSVIPKSDYVILQEVVKQLEIRLEEERLAKVAAQTERDNIDKKYSEKVQTIPDDEPDVFSFRSLANELRLESLDSDVEEVFDEINAENPIKKNNKVITKLIENDYVNVKGTDNEDRTRAYYSLTQEGKSFEEYWLNSNQ